MDVLESEGSARVCAEVDSDRDEVPVTFATMDGTAVGTFRALQQSTEPVHNRQQHLKLPVVHSSFQLDLTMKLLIGRSYSPHVLMGGSLVGV